MRLHNEKGSDFIPLFAGRLLPNVPKLHLLVGGVGPMEKAIKEALARTAFGDRVHFIGWENDTPSFLSACDFFWSLSREESFPQTLIEASAMGLPWIAPDTGGVSELLLAGAIGRIFPRLEIQKASDEAAVVVQDLTRISEEARRAAPAIQQGYSLSRMTSRIYNVFARF